eukprot:CAMPEP_0178573648 /NCGR_PEP_ID=MMETSP0697-20121206/18892_1 /TAXON_ID=265572 /ORGANISM="Extubocellulus spinifer, Strain CCMP396" /LENGTH=214 /DNA_ID=CAMNT_0020208505 /DNA_START=205 /DNA_END=846 /DNA_ORIENTATION=-
MKLSFIHILASVVTVVEGSGGLRHLQQIDKEQLAAAAGTTLSQLHEALDVDDDETRQHVRKLGGKKKKKKKKRKKKDKDKDSEDGDSGGKRLTLYCEDKFRWRDKKKCLDWCLEADSCKSGAKIRIRRCGGSKMQKWKKDGSALRPACSSRLSVGNGELKKGRTELSGLSSGGKFTIKKNGMCMTNPHQPEDREKVSFRDCRKASNSKTDKWEW